MRKTKIKLAIIVLIGFMLRVYKLADLSLWINEAKVVCFAKKDLLSVFQFTDFYRPVYLLLSRIWLNVFGMDEFFVRLLPAVLGSLSIILMYRIGRMLWDRKTGLVAAYILCLSVFHVYFSRQGKGVSSLLVFLCLISFLLMLKIHTKKKTKYYFYIFFTNILILCSHPVGIFYVFTEKICHLFLNNRKVDIKWNILLIAIGCVLFPWFYYVGLFTPDKFSVNFLPVSLLDIAKFFEVFSCGGRQLVHGGEGYKLSYARMIMPWVLTSIYFSIFVSELFCNKNKIKNVLLVWLLLPLILILTYSYFIQPIYWPRYVIYSLPAFYLLLAHFIAGFRKGCVIILVAVSFLSIGSLNNIYNPQFKEGFKEATYFLKDKLKNNDIVVFAPAEMMAGIFYYLKNDDLDIMGRIDDDKGMLFDKKWETDFIFENNRFICLQFDDIARFSEDFSFEKYNFAGAPADGIWVFYAPDWALNENSKWLIEHLEENYEPIFNEFFKRQNLFLKYYRVNK
ncbi:MAG: glycosyltransferase family 39 protein [Candidatus Omnitrophica bacterium]|nr:glycosyltransferase family 39 protein [Candidatus Omnitrophota bacterium]